MSIMLALTFIDERAARKSGGSGGGDEPHHVPASTSQQPGSDPVQSVTDAFSHVSAQDARVVGPAEHSSSSPVQPTREGRFRFNAEAAVFVPAESPVSCDTDVSRDGSKSNNNDGSTSTIMPSKAPDEAGEAESLRNDRVSDAAVTAVSDQGNLGNSETSIDDERSELGEVEKLDDMSTVKNEDASMSDQRSDTEHDTGCGPTTDSNDCDGNEGSGWPDDNDDSAWNGGEASRSNIDDDSAWGPGPVSQSVWDNWGNHGFGYADEIPTRPTVSPFTNPGRVLGGTRQGPVDPSALRALRTNHHTADGSGTVQTEAGRRQANTRNLQRAVNARAQEREEYLKRLDKDARRKDKE